MSNFIINEASYKFDGSLKLANERLNADQAPRVTFWGTRFVKFDGQDVSLNNLICLICRISLAKITPVHTLEDRIAGIEIGRKLRNYYILTNEQIKNSNFITRFFAWIRERKISWIQKECIFLSSLSATSSLLLARNNFCCFTTEKFLAQFGGSFINNTHPACRAFYKKPGRVYAKEEAMRAQLEKEKAKSSLSIITRVFSYVRNLCFCPLSTEKLK